MTRITHSSKAVAQRSPQRNALGLTPRQMQVARLAAQGLTRPQIAAQIDISVHAVEMLLTEACHDTGINGRGARMLLAYVLGVWDAGRPTVARQLCPAHRQEAQP